MRLHRLSGVEPRLIAIWDRLTRAEEHFQEIERMLLAYYRTSYGEVRGKLDPDANTAFLQVSGFKLPHPRLYTRTGELLHDLRSALEHLAWELVEVSGGEPTENTSFPVLKTRPEPNRKGVHPKPGLAGGVSEAGAAVIDAAQPYQWGARYAEHPVWVLDKLWNIDKHRHIALSGLRADGFVIPPGTPSFTFRMELESTSVDGAELRIVPDDPRVDVDLRSTMQIVVYEPKDGVSTPLRGTLQRVRLAVFKIMREAENTCF